MRKLFLISLLFLGACYEKPVERSSTNNPDVAVDLLFSHGGCDVYRFDDGGRSHYFANCGGSASTSSTKSCGKSCTREEVIVTP